jgi:hypothetical protein
MRRTNLGAALAALTAACAAALVLASGAAAAAFTTPVRLSNPPVGGEPSIATDPQGDVFVAGPQGIPAGVSGHPGTGMWISRNDGASFQTGKFIGSDIGGGDDDVIYDAGAVYTADLEAIASEVCKSTDRGQTWTGVGPVPDSAGCTTINAGQVGPSDDRPWLTSDPTNGQRLYVTYHEFVSAEPIAFRSDNGGADDFANPCGPIITDPTIQANAPTDITGGTLVARPVTDKAGNLYILFVTTTQQQNLAALAQGFPSGTFSQVYLAVSHDHCQTFTDHTVFDGSKMGTNTVQFGDIFNDLAIDGAGNLYAVAAGAVGTKAFPTTTNVYLLKSTDHGVHWSSPLLLDKTNAAHMLPAAVGGPKGGQLEIGYFRTTNGVTDPNSLSGQWTYTTAETTNATAGSPGFTYRDVNPGFIYHHGQICNAGVLCGATPNGPSDRSLLDFTSAALDAHGCPLFTFAGNPTGSPTNNNTTNTYNYVTRQLTGCFTPVVGTTLTSSSSAGASFSAKKTTTAHKKHRKHKRHRRHRRARRISRPPRRSAGFTG